MKDTNMKNMKKTIDQVLDNCWASKAEDISQHTKILLDSFDIPKSVPCWLCASPVSDKTEVNRPVPRCESCKKKGIWL
jgi:hypothetical protein